MRFLTLHQQADYSFVLQPWQLYVAIIAGWIQRRQQEAIEYLRAENRVLRETHGSRRILLNDDQRRRLAVKDKILGRQRLKEIGTLFTPDRFFAGIECLSPRNGTTVGAGKRFLIMDRDSKFTDEFREMLDGEGVEPVRLPPRSPNLNPHIERFIRSIKDESLFENDTLR